TGRTEGERARRATRSRPPGLPLVPVAVRDRPAGPRWAGSGRPPPATTAPQPIRGEAPEPRAEREGARGLGSHLLDLAADLAAGELDRVEVDVGEPLDDPRQVVRQRRAVVALRQVPDAAEGPPDTGGERGDHELVRGGVVVGAAEEPPADRRVGPG